MKTPDFKAYSMNIAGSILILFCLMSSANTAFSAPDQQTGINDAHSEPTSLKRDPFWPVGYVPERVRNLAEEKVEPESGAVKVDSTWNEAMKKVVINGVSRRGNNDAFAVINGEVRSAGDTVSVSHGGAIYTWVVDSIKLPSAVKLRRISVQK